MTWAHDQRFVCCVPSSLIVCVCTWVEGRAGLARLPEGVLHTHTTTFRLGHSTKKGSHTLTAFVTAVTRAAHVCVCRGQKQSDNTQKQINNKKTTTETHMCVAHPRRRVHPDPRRVPAYTHTWTSPPCSHSDRSYTCLEPHTHPHLTQRDKYINTCEEAIINPASSWLSQHRAESCVLWCCTPRLMTSFTD